MNNTQQDEVKFHKDDLIVMEYCGDICLGHVEHAVNDTACIVVGKLRRWRSNDELNEKKAKVVGKRIFKKRFGLFPYHVDVFFEN